MTAPVVLHGWAVVRKSTGDVVATYATKVEARSHASEVQKMKDRHRQASAGRAPRGELTVRPTLSVALGSVVDLGLDDRDVAQVAADAGVDPRTVRRALADDARTRSALTRRAIAVSLRKFGHDVAARRLERAESRKAKTRKARAFVKDIGALVAPPKGAQS